MIYTQKGITLSYIKYEEHSIIVRIYTAYFGLQSFLVRGLRKAGNKQLQIGSFYPLSVLELVTHHRPLKELQYIKELRTAYVYRSLPFVIEKQPYVALFVALLEQVLEPYDEPNEEDPRFTFVLRSCCAFDQIEQNFDFFALQFLSKLSYHIGIALTESHLNAFARAKLATRSADQLTEDVMNAYRTPYDLKNKRPKSAWVPEGIELLLHYYDQQWLAEGPTRPHLTQRITNIWNRLMA